ncbi:MAG TPA: hypothetical protein VIJ56_06215 [Acidimicrobiales bacterium]
MQLELECKVAVVTGASRGIGLAAEGARVVAGARSSSAELDALVETAHAAITSPWRPPPRLCF